MRLLKSVLFTGMLCTSAVTPIAQNLPTEPSGFSGRAEVGAPSLRGLALASRALHKGIPAAPVTDPLNTLAGYLLGKSSGAETVGAGAVDGTKPKPKQASNASA